MLCELSLCFHICLHVRGKEGGNRLSYHTGKGMERECQGQQLPVLSPPWTSCPVPLQHHLLVPGRRRVSLGGGGKQSHPGDSTKPPGAGQPLLPFAGVRNAKPWWGLATSARDSPAEPFSFSGTAENPEEEEAFTGHSLAGWLAEGAGVCVSQWEAPFCSNGDSQH